MNATTFVVGPMPPPVHGYSLVTNLVAERLKLAAANVRVIDTSPDDLAKSWRYHAQRLWRVNLGIAVLLCRRSRGDTLYLAIAGGSGVVYDIAFAAVARLGHYRLFIHHHAFSYINRWSFLTSIFLRLAGSNAVHICLCQHMGMLLQQRYEVKRDVRIVSNAAFMQLAGMNAPKRMDRLRIGFLSNLMPEKGFDVVLEVFRAAYREGAASDLIVGGPMIDKATGELIAAAGREFGPAFEYRGALSGDAKDRFFADIDIFIFPTRYANEAEPLVVLEALAAGKPVIATARGCIQDVVSVAAGRVVSGEHFVETALDTLLEWSRDPERLSAASAEACGRAKQLSDMAQNNLKDLIADMTRRPASTIS